MPPSRRRLKWVAYGVHISPLGPRPIIFHDPPAPEPAPDPAPVLTIGDTIHSPADLFDYNATYRFWFCRECQHAIRPEKAAVHVTQKHPQRAISPKHKLAAILSAKLDQRPAFDPRDPDQVPSIPPDSPPVHGLAIYPAYECPACRKADRTLKALGQHVLTAHAGDKTHFIRNHQRGRSSYQYRVNKTLPIIPGTRTTARIIRCQRFFCGGGAVGKACSYFGICPPSQGSDTRGQAEGGGGGGGGEGGEGGRINNASMTSAELMRTLVYQQLEQNTANVYQEPISSTAAPTEISPWLEMTRWPQYLHGCPFPTAAALGEMPGPDDGCQHQPLLERFCASVERLIQRAFHSIQNRRINEFDQVRINSFITQRPRVWDRPIVIRLKPKTYQNYRRIWQRLICFAYRTSRPDQTMPLRHQLTTSQLVALDRMIEQAEQLAPPVSSSTVTAVQEQLDRACLEFSIALLDHPLPEEIFESTVIGFLAILGVDAERQTFRDPANYTTMLSGLVKMAQMLVVEQSVQMADDKIVRHPCDALHEMQERFLMHGVAAPFGWITRLRAYGKKIQNTTTSLGYIYWDDHQETLSYRELTLSMANFREFVRHQMELAQQDLEKLFLLHEEESREQVIPLVPLHQLHDDPANNTRRWNFLHDRQTKAALPVSGDRWLLDRVLTTRWLTDEFLKLSGGASQIKWKNRPVERYFQQVDQFLERLCLLIHITGGQPGRGTELMSLRHCNTLCGRHRNIFIEHGLISTVTRYHKGYSIQGSTKIIHRYLPREVSELVVYYLWLILPFWEQLDVLARGRVKGPSPFLWPSKEENWNPSRLRVVLEREARTHLQTKMNILLYRHAAIAISRVHLKCGGFKRDYGSDDGPTSEQAAHGPWAAGTIYARGLREAPGHVEARRVRYRAISREWHQFLGFEVARAPRQTDDIEGRASEGRASGTRSRRQYVMVELDRE